MIGISKVIELITSQDHECIVTFHLMFNAVIIKYLLSLIERNISASLWVIEICRNYEEQHHNEEGGGGCSNCYVTLPVNQGGPARHEARLSMN